jgi:uncharacterized membrane protein YdfJ with MMPL/SSD domain
VLPIAFALLALMVRCCSWWYCRSSSRRSSLADALSSAGHAILVSGVTLIIACVGLLIIPMDAVGALGVGCAVAVASVLASNRGDAVLPRLLSRR